MIVEIISNCVKKSLSLLVAPIQHQSLNALLAQLDRASVF